MLQALRHSDPNAKTRLRPQHQNRLRPQHQPQHQNRLRPQHTKTDSDPNAKLLRLRPQRQVPLRRQPQRRLDLCRPRITIQPSADSVPVDYSGAQTAGNLNVVVVAWNDTTAKVSSVTDTAGNVYQLAAAPTQTSDDGGLSLSIYYAKNIASSGANTVTVTFSQTAQYPDIRILEYSGIDQVNPVDVVAGQTQSSGATSDSGVVATTNPTDLLVGANIVQTFTAAAGATFAERVHSEPDGQIAEDRVVTATGLYSASAVLDSPGAWVMQMVAFRAASTSSTTASAKSALLVGLRE